MATLILTTVGTIVGGPIGGAVGALIGSSVDRALFAPKGRHGPRLGDRSVQVSSYGEPIARLFGTMRVAGTVIWATDLREERKKVAGGKGGGSATTYSYFGSFAVALSARPIRAVHRIWADGKLLRGEGGHWKSEVGAFRLLTGTEDQPVDPLIASAEGIDTTPAYRGVAYAVFRDLALADFGNRIPSLTFEVEADEGAVAIGAIAEALCEGALIGDTDAALGGYAASGESVRGAVETLARAFPLTLIDDGEQLLLRDTAPPPVAIAAAALGAGDGRERRARAKSEREATSTLPDEVAVAYYEPSRDYQSGLQRARRGGPARRDEVIALPATLTAVEAKACAEQRLATRWAERLAATIWVPWRHVTLRPGARLTLPGSTAQWRVAKWTLDRSALALELRRASQSSAPSPMAAPGRAVPSPDTPIGPTRLAVLDLPPIDGFAGTTPHIWIAACGTGEGWRRAALALSGNDGATWEPIGDTAAPATLGVALDALPGGALNLFDTLATVEVELANDSVPLIGRDDDALCNGANLAVIGGELIQFGVANPTGPRRWRLSRLLRGRRGTEWAMDDHVAGEQFVLIEPDTLLARPVGSAAIGATVRVMAAGIGDGDVPAEADVVVAAHALRPPAPIHLSARRLDDGTVQIVWTRRSRQGWAWLDGGDAPIGEEAERYRLVIAPDVGVARTVETAQPAYEYLPSEQAADGSGGMTAISVAVAQLGTIAASNPPVSRTIPL